MIDTSLLKFPKKGRVKLKGVAYLQVKETVFRLDGHRCKVCGRTYWLTPHHMVKRSTLRLDVVENLLTLCAPCNDDEKDGRIKIEWLNPQARTILVTRNPRPTKLPLP